MTPIPTATVRALVLDADRPIGRACRDHLRRIGHDVDVAGDEHPPGDVDVLVNATFAWRPTPADAGREQVRVDVDELFAANVRRPLLAQRSVVSGMIDRGGGHIVNVTIAEVLPPLDDGEAASVAADPVAADPDAVVDVAAASKWALNGFTQGWALGLARHGIRVNAIAVEPTTPPDAVGEALVALLSEGPTGRSGETVRAGHPLPPRRRRGEAIT